MNISNINCAMPSNPGGFAAHPYASALPIAASAAVGSAVGLSMLAKDIYDKKKNQAKDPT